MNATVHGLRISHVKIKLIRILVQRFFAQMFQHLLLIVVIIGSKFIVFFLFKKAQVISVLRLMTLPVGLRLGL
jgi:hypothetical protein